MAQTFDVQSFTYPIFSGTNIDFSYLEQVAVVLKSEGANTIQINPFLTMKNLSNTNLITQFNPDITQYNNPPIDADVIKLINFFEQKGFKVDLKVSIQPQDNSFSGNIIPSDINAFFNDYKNSLLDYAKICQTYNIKNFIISNELESLTTNNIYKNYWASIISDIKAVYKGNIGVNATVPYEAQHLSFGNLLDFIGISFYPKLTELTNPTLKDLISAWTKDAYSNNWLQIFNNIHELYNKPIEVTEIALLSRQNAAANANSTSNLGPPDPYIQALEYQSFFQIFSTLPSWFRGVSFWQVAEYSPFSFLAMNTPSDYGSSGSTVEDKPAQSVVASFFGGEFIITGILKILLAL